jgi:hypothetical protein
MRFNPRQRWDENRRGRTVSSNIAGVPLCMLRQFTELADIYIARPIARSEHEAAHYAGSDRAYKAMLMEFSDQLKSALDEFEDTGTTGWVERKRLKIRGGRGSGPDQEMTLVAHNYSDVRSYLTNASLALSDRVKAQHGEEWYRGGTKWQQLLALVLDRLDKSSDRRENTWDYRDKSIAEIRTLAWAKGALDRRKEQVRANIRFRKMMDKVVKVRGPRIGRIGITDWKVAQKLAESAQTASAT